MLKNKGWTERLFSQTENFAEYAKQTKKYTKNNC